MSDKQAAERWAASQDFGTDPGVTTEHSPPPDDAGRVIPFRPRGAVRGWRWPLNNFPRGDAPIDDLAKYERTESEDNYRHRMTMNALGFLVTIVLIFIGVWLANTISEMVKNQDCFLSGRRNCMQIDVPPIQRH
jgi:hypothetical protein